jgi:hypothetical protein
MIDVMQAATHGLSNDLPIVRFGDWELDCAWRALTDRAVWALALERPDLNFPLGLPRNRT